MESSSSGHFEDYSTSPQRNSGTATGNGGASEDNRCALKLETVRLEEIEKADYFKRHNGVPKNGIAVKLRTELTEGRLTVETTKEEESVGFLPTQFNYLLACLRDGWSYSGQITASTAQPVPKILVTLNPS